MIGSVLRIRYELTGLLSDGSIFATYMARDRVQNRDVSVRVFKQPFPSEPTFVKKVAEVVRKAAVVSSANVEKLYEVDEDEGTPFIVGELSRGNSLSERIRKLAPYSAPVAVSMAISILEGLDAIHHAGLVHGDISSSNVVVMPDGNARLQMGGIWEAYSASGMAGALVLPSMAPYLAPEVSAGGMPSQQSDIYAVGVILFELLAGRHPYIAETPVSMAMKHSTNPTPSVRLLNPSVPVVLDEIIKKAMSKEASLRYQHAGEMLSDLRILQDAVRFGRTLTWPLKSASTTQAVKSQPVTPKMSAIRSEPAEAREKRERDSGGDVPGWMMALFMLVIGGAVCLVGVWLVLNLKRPRLVNVPHIKGLTRTEAQSTLESMHLEMRVGARQSSEEVPADSVIDLSPLPDEQVREGGTVTVVLSTGSKFVHVPKLTGYTLDEARSILKKYNLDLDENVSRVRSFNIEQDHIVSQSPKPDDKVEQFQKIRVTVSSGTSGSGSSEEPEPGRNDEMDRYDYSLRISLGKISKPVTVRVEMTDSLSTKTIYEERHQPEDTIDLSESGYGPQVVFKIYYDDKLVKTVTKRADEGDQG